MISVAEAYDKYDPETLDPPLSMMEFLSSEGGHKCVVCCKYRRKDDLFITGTPDHGHILTRELHMAITVQPICSECLKREANP